MTTETYEIDGRLFATAEGTLRLYEVGEEVNPRDIDSSFVALVDGELVRFDERRSFQEPDDPRWYRYVGSKPSRHGSNHPHATEGGEDVRVVDAVMPADREPCPECGEGWTDADKPDDEKYCLECGLGLRD